MEGAGALILGSGALGVNALAAEAFAQTIRESRAGASRYWPTLARLDGVALDMPAIRERIFAVYSSRCPDKLKGLGKLLAKYSGREYELCTKIQQKYIEQQGTQGGCPAPSSEPEPEPEAEAEPIDPTKLAFEKGQQVYLCSDKGEIQKSVIGTVLEITGPSKNNYVPTPVNM